MARRLFLFACCLLPVACCLADNRESPETASPADRWFVSVITQPGCPACEKLKRDLQAPPLSLIASETTLQVFDLAQPDNRRHWRWRKFDGFPAIVVQPPKSGRAGDPVSAAVQWQGYDGDAVGLAAKIRAAAGIPTPEVQPDPTPPNPAPVDRSLERLRRKPKPPDTPAPPGTTRRYHPLRGFLDGVAAWWTFGTATARMLTWLELLAVVAVVVWIFRAIVTTLRGAPRGN